MSAHDRPAAKAAIYVTEADYDQLSRLTLSTLPGAALLRRELARAIVIKEDEGPRGFIQLGSEVKYRDLISERTRTVRLVLPSEADIHEHRVSVLAPVGALLIGLSRGDTLSWTGEDGYPRLISVISVEHSHVTS